MNENEMQYDPAEMNTQVLAYEGAAVMEQTGKKREVNILLLGGIAITAIIVIAALVIGMITSSPLGLLATGFRNSMEAMENNALTKLTEQVSNGGSMELSMDLTALLEQSGLPVSGTGSVKIYTYEEEQKAAITLGVQLAGQKLDASLFSNQESVVIASDWLLGDKAYGITLENFVENFNKSVFGSDGAYSLGIEIPENFQEQMDQYQNCTEDTKKIVTQLVTQLGKTLETNSTVEKEKATLSLGGENVKTTAVIIKIDPNQLAAIVEEMLQYLRTDEEFKAYVEEYKEIMFSSATYEGMDADALAQEFFQMLDDTAENFDELKQEILDEEARLDATFYITKSGKQLIGVELFFGSNIEPSKANLYAGPDLKSAKEFRFEIGPEDETIQGTYLVKVDDENTFVALLDLNENEEVLVKADVRWDKQTGAWEVTATDDYDDTIAIRGTLEIADKELSAKLESIEAEGQKVELGIGMVLRAEDAMPEMPQYTDLLKMTEDEVTSLVNDLKMVFFQLAYGMVGV